MALTTFNPRRWIQASLLLATVCIPLCADAETLTPTPSQEGLVTTYTNPSGFSAADPFIHQEDGIYYLYATTTPHRGFEVFTSDDLVHWRRRGMCYEKSEAAWGKTDFWAPEVVKKDDTYYMYFTARNPGDGIRNTCVATSKSPAGPFTEVKAPLFPQGSFIDGHVYQDDTTGHWYIYATQEGRVPSTIFGARLDDTMLETATSFTVCLTPDQHWEDGWIEGSLVILHDDTYYMMYSGSAFWEPDYAVGYATAPHPLGPWTKYDKNPILHRRGEVHGPGHNCVAWSPDGTELFMVYHRHATFWNPRRDLAIDRIVFEPSPSGPPLMTLPEAPSITPQPLPSGSIPRRIGSTDDFTSSGLDFSRWMTMGENPDAWRITSDSLVISTARGDFFRLHEGGRNLFLQYAPPGDFTVGAHITFPAGHNDNQAFITVWQDQDNYIFLTTGQYDGPGFATLHERHAKNSMYVYPNKIGDEVQLRIRHRDGFYTPQVSADGSEWIDIGPGIQSDLNPVHVGLGAWSPGSDRSVDAVFSRFELNADR